MLKYSYSKQLRIPFDEAIEKTIASLKQEGFGILTDINVKETLKEKIGIDFKQYRILGACNPPSALEALQSEEEIGLLLPCNVIVYEKDESVIVSAIKPSIVFAVIDNKELESLADEVGEMLKQVIDML